jgi:hypothetical protein
MLVGMSIPLVRTARVLSKGQITIPKAIRDAPDPKDLAKP